MLESKHKVEPVFESALDALKGLSPDDKAASISEKVEVLKRYPLVFKDVDVVQSNVVPILMQRKEVHLFIERIYNKQHELILKRKSVDVLGLPRIVREMIAEQNNITRLHFIQSISNLVYSADRYSSKYPELGIFLDFCTVGSDPYFLLFYIFIRQHFKILTYTNFLAHQKSAPDPAAIVLSREMGSEILRTAFSHDPVAHGQLREEFNALYKEKPKATYYDFMVRMVKVKMNFKDLVLLEKLLALYTIDYQDQLKRHLESKSPKVRRGHKDGGQSQDMVKRDSIDQVVFGNQTPSPEHTIKVAAHAPEEGVMDIQETEAKPPSSNVRIKKEDPNKRPRLVLARKTLENFYLAVKTHIPVFIQSLLMSFPVSKNFDLTKVQESSNVIGVLIENKLAALVDALFAENSRKFDRLLRDEHRLSPDTAKAWEKLVEVLHREDIDTNFTDKDIMDVLKTIDEIPVIRTHVAFLVGYRFKTEKELLELQAKERELLAQV